MKSPKRLIQQIPYMMTLLIVNLCLFCINIGKCLATDWFVRPAAAAYGSGDGSTFDNAWSGFSSIKWVNILPDDNLYICDTHIGGILDIRASGSDNHPINIRGDYPGHAGTIIGASEVYTDGWVLHDQQYNIWKRVLSKLPTFYSDWHAFACPKDDKQPDAIMRLNNVGNPSTGGTGEKTAFSTWQPGSFFRDDMTIYYKPISGSANDYVYYAGYLQSAAGSNGAHHFTILNLSVMMGAGSEYGGIVSLSNVHHVTLQGLTIKWGANGIVFSPAWADRYNVTSDYINVIGCTISDCRAGIYPYGIINHVLIKDNHIYNMDQNGYYVYMKNGLWWGDVHGIALQGGGNDVKIEHNYVHHIGNEGIIIYGDNNPDGVNAQILQNFNIQYNVVHDIVYVASSTKPKYSGGKQPAIYYSQNNDFPSSGLSNNVIAYNVLYNAEHGVRLKCNTNQSTGKAPWAIYNNVIYNTNIGFCWYSTGSTNSYNKPGVLFFNNIVMEPKSQFVTIARPTITEYDQLIFDNNIYYPQIENGFAWPSGSGNFTAWQNWNSAAKTDQNSKVIDPKFRDPLNLDFHLNQGSPAINSGKDVGLTEDFDGKSVPQGLTPSIGIFEVSIVAPPEKLRISQ